MVGKWDCKGTTLFSGQPVSGQLVDKWSEWISETGSQFLGHSVSFADTVSKEWVAVWDLSYLLVHARFWDMFMHTEAELNCGFLEYVFM